MALERLYKISLHFSLPELLSMYKSDSGDLSDSTAARAFASLVADVGSISGIANEPLSPLEVIFLK